MKKRTYKRLQAMIQNTYMGLFVTGCYFIAFFKKFGTWYEFRYVLALVIITGILTILKAKTYLSKKSNRIKLMKSIAEDLKSENGIEL